MELSPRLYHWFVRPKWYTKLFVNNTLKYLLEDFDFHNKMVLDFGCGIGSNCIMFKPNSYIGIDCDSKRINYAKSIYKNYRFKVYDGYNLPFLNKSVDYVLIMAVLHHISPKETSLYLKDFYRILKDNGKIIVIEPCFSNKKSFNNWCMKNFDRGRHIRNEEEYLKMFRENFYEVNNVKRFRKCLFYNELFFTATPQLK